MTIVSANDTPEQIADAMRAHGFEPNEPSTQPQVNPADVPLSEVPADEQEIPASADDTTGTGPDPAQPSTEQAPADKKRKSIQKRIDELTAERYTERGKREAAEAEVTRLRAQLAGQPVEAAAAEDVADTVTSLVQPKHPGKAPRFNDFDSIEDYTAAADAHDAALEKYQGDMSTPSNRRVSKSIPVLQPESRNVTKPKFRPNGTRNFRLPRPTSPTSNRPCRPPKETSRRP